MNNTMLLLNVTSSSHSQATRFK